MALVRYSLLRLLVLAVVAALLWLAGMRGLGLLFVAVLVSGIVSFFALRGNRDQLSVVLDRRLAAIKARLAERASAEDAWDDAQRAEHGRRPRGGDES